MINPATLTQLKAFARQDGLLLGLVWTASFVLTMLSPQSVWGNMLAMSTPFFMGWRLCKFRDGALDGVISFRRGFAYCVYSAIFASLVFALAQVVYFRFFDNGTFMGILNDGIRVVEDVYRQQNMDTTELRHAVDTMNEVSPVQWVFALMMQNIVLGTLLALPVAAICAKRAPEKAE